jgi:hypothetical protein
MQLPNFLLLIMILIFSPWFLRKYFEISTCLFLSAIVIHVVSSESIELISTTLYLLLKIALSYIANF